MNSWLHIVNDERSIASGICSVFVVIKCDPSRQIIRRQVREAKSTDKVAYGGISRSLAVGKRQEKGKYKVRKPSLREFANERNMFMRFFNENNDNNANEN